MRKGGKHNADEVADGYNVWLVWRWPHWEGISDLADEAGAAGGFSEYEISWKLEHRMRSRSVRVLQVFSEHKQAYR